MLMNGDSTTGEGGAQLTGLELPDLVGEADRVIARYDALVLQREDQVQILASERHKGSAPFAGRLTETLIKLLHVVLPKKTIGLLQSLDLLRPQFWRQASLPGAKPTFTAPSCLWGISRNHLNPQLSQTSPHLLHPMPLHALPGFRCEEEMAGSIAIKGTKHSLLLNHCA